MQQVALDVEAGGVHARQDADRGETQCQVLDGINAEVDDRLTNRSDFLRQAVVGRVDDLENLHGHHRVLLDDPDQILGQAIDVAREF